MFFPRKTLAIIAISRYGPAAVFLLNHLALSVFHMVRMYENGFEMDLPRSWSNTFFLPFRRIRRCCWDDGMLRYERGEGGPIVLRKDLRPGSMPVAFLFFPRALRVPADEITRLSALLERATAPQPGH